MQVFDVAAPFLTLLPAITLVEGQPHHHLARCQSKSEQEDRFLE